MRILIQLINPLGIERGSATLDTVDLIPLSEQQLRQITAILAGNSGNQCLPHARSISLKKPNLKSKIAISKAGTHAQRRGNHSHNGSQHLVNRPWTADHLIFDMFE